MEQPSFGKQGRGLTQGQPSGARGKTAPHLATLFSAAGPGSAGLPLRGPLNEPWMARALGTAPAMAPWAPLPIFRTKGSTWSTRKLTREG